MPGQVLTECRETYQQEASLPAVVAGVTSRLHSDDLREGGQAA